MNTLWTTDCSKIQKEDAHIKKDIKNMLIFLMHSTILTFIKYTNFVTHCLDGPGVYLICSAALPGVCIFEPLCVYEPSINMVYMYVCMFVQMPLCVYVRACIVYACVCACVCTYIRIYLSMCVCMCMYVRTYIFKHVRVYALNLHWLLSAIILICYAAVKLKCKSTVFCFIIASSVTPSASGQ